MNVAVRPGSGLHFISLCTGGGGLDLGIELAIPEARPCVYVEREAFSVAHLVAAMQEGLLAPAPVWSDVRSFDGLRWRGLVDGLVGGIPCQGHSVAGKKRGSLDDRDLWSPARRIIVQARPKFVFIENVGGMLTPGADEIAGAERLWRDLRKLGFAVEAGLFTAAEVGATHERERFFCLAVAEPVAGADMGYAHDSRLEGRNSGELRERSGERTAWSHGRELVERHGLFPPGPADLTEWKKILGRWPEVEPAIHGVAHELALGMDTAGARAARIERLRLLGNGVVPLQSALAFRTLATRLASAGSASAAWLLRMMNLPVNQKEICA